MSAAARGAAPKALRALQESLHGYLLEGRSGIGAHVIGTQRADAQTRLGIYYEAYRLRLEEALAADFPVLKALLGDEEFARMSRAYVAASPSRHFSVRWFGARLAAFLKASSPWSARAELGELAAFEWALGEVFDAPDAPVLQRAALSTLPAEAWPELRLRLHPALRRLDLHYNVAALWHALEEATSSPAAEVSEAPVRWVVWRKDLRTYFRSLPPADACALDALGEGASFGELCEKLCAWMPPEQVAPHAAALLQVWVDEHMISAICL